MMKMRVSFLKTRNISSNMKTYIIPALQVNEAQAQNMMAVSLLDGGADSSKEVLTKEDDNWDFWGDEAE